ncbi:hypothetical protein [Actinomadura sp. GTD37]|uniref:hypothetical protein n=1 Tax=Actinomadura sp. GTD37 TaxID=1778030 RepID=UPI0035C1C60B
MPKTASPSANPVTPGPVAATTPDASEPGVQGNGTPGRSHLFALLGAVASIADAAPTLAGRRDHLLRLVMDGLAAER